MSWLSKILHRDDAVDREIDEELRFHIEQRIERYIHAGMTPEQAQRKALDRFGNFEQIREAVRAIDLGTIESVWQDVRYAARTLAKSPGFTSVALLSLTLGIGLNTAIFSAINAVLLRPLPYKDPDRIVSLYASFKKNPNERSTISLADYLDWERQNRVFEAMAAMDRYSGTLALIDSGEPEQVRSLRVSATFFRILGVQAALGRTFLSEEDKPASNVVVLSHDLWRRRFRADPNVLGRDITLNRDSYRVIGVMPERFRYFKQFVYPIGAQDVDLWLSYPFEGNAPSNRQYYTLMAIARLKPGVSLKQARRYEDGPCGRGESTPQGK